jgi:signal transduction histidine kinase
VTVGRIAVGLRRNSGIIATLAVVAVGVMSAVAAVSRPPLQPDAWPFQPAEMWPWWPGPPNDALLLFVGAQLALGVAAFFRLPRNGVGQALLGGSAANAGSVALWSTIQAPELARASSSWLAFVAAGFLSLILWSSLLHLVFVFPTRDRRVDESGWLIPLIYVLPPVALGIGALLTGGLTPTSLDWLGAWGQLHAAIVSLMLTVGIVGIAHRLRSMSPVRRRQVGGIALSVMAAAFASLLLVDLPVMLGGGPVVPRELVILLALPIPVFLAAALWQDRSFRHNRLRRRQMELLHAREEERRRLRRDLHDGLGPTLAAIGLKIDAAASWVERDPATAGQLLQEIRRDLTASMADTRRLVRGLRPPALDELGLTAAVRHVADEFGAGGDGGPIITVSADGLPPLPAAVEVAAYRIIQESLTNSVRHARAGRIDVNLTADGAEALRIDVTDDGIGFEPGERAGVGTEAMRERAEEIGGELVFARPAGGGTSVQVSLPLWRLAREA